MTARDFVVTLLKSPLLATLGFSLEGAPITGHEISAVLLRQLDPKVPSWRIPGGRHLGVVVDPKLREPAGYSGYYHHIVLQCEPRLGDYLMEAAVVHECTHVYLSSKKLKDDEVAAYLMTVLYEYTKSPDRTFDSYSPKQFYCVPRLEVVKIYEEAMNLILRLEMHHRTCLLTTNDVKPLREALCRVEEYRHRVRCPT